MNVSFDQRQMIHLFHLHPIHLHATERKGFPHLGPVYFPCRICFLKIITGGCLSISPAAESKSQVRDIRTGRGRITMSMLRVVVIVMTVVLIDGEALFRGGERIVWRHSRRPSSSRHRCWLRMEELSWHI